MDEGFILSNKYRRAIFDEFIAGETNINRIAKKHRIIRIVAQRTVTEFIQGGLVEKKDEHNIILTKKGQKLAATLA